MIVYESWQPVYTSNDEKCIIHTYIHLVCIHVCTQPSNRYLPVYWILGQYIMRASGSCVTMSGASLHIYVDWSVWQCQGLVYIYSLVCVIRRQLNLIVRLDIYVCIYTWGRTNPSVYTWHISKTIWEQNSVWYVAGITPVRRTMVQFHTPDIP